MSAGENNEELVCNLVEAEYIKTPIVEQVFRAVDRGDYYLKDHRDSAYKDLAWKHGNIHLSAPCIYAEVLESLCLAPGLSFLNLGSGTGYLNTMAGLILGPYGVNHGVEYHQDVIDYAVAGLERFRQMADSFDEFEFCEPVFTRGNCLLLSPHCRLYDRLYCGAACPPEHENYMKNLINIGGILVMPLNDQLLQITRTSETTWETKNILPVSFASLIMPNGTGPIDLIDLPSSKPMTLQEVCRTVVRRILRKNIQLEYPSLSPGATARRRPPRPRRPRRCEHRRRINFIPMQAGLMIVGQFPPMDSDDENADRGLGTDDDDHNAAMSDGENVDRDNDSSPSESAFLRPLFWRSPADLLRNDSATEEDMAFGVEADEDREVRMENGVAYKDGESHDSDSDEEIGAAAAMDSTESAQVSSNTASEAIVIHTSEPSSTNGYSTSYSSGIGTCSSLGAESESGNSTDIASTDDLFKNGTSAAASRDGVFDDDAFGVDLSSVSALKTLLQTRSGTEDHHGERMEDIVEVQEEACTAAEAEEVDCLADEPAEADPGITFRNCMRDKVNLLPVPAALKDYLMFYRK